MNAASGTLAPMLRRMNTLSSHVRGRKVRPARDPGMSNWCGDALARGNKLWLICQPV